jgi:hypothetical protein
MNKIPVSLEFYVKFNRLDKKVFVSLYEVFNENRLLSALVSDAEIKIRFWDNKKTIENKIKKAKAKLLMKFYKDKNLNESIFKMCKELSKGRIEVGFLEVGEEGKETNETDNILKLKDFLDKRK